MFLNYLAEMAQAHRDLHWLHLVALTAALLAALPLAIGASFWHIDNPGTEATCQICHVAHMLVLPGALAMVQAKLNVLAWIVPTEANASHSAPAGLDFPPRAPPA